MPHPSQQEAVEELLRRSRRSFVPLRRSFLQHRGAERGRGPLAAFAKRSTALDLYLLVHALASAPPWDVALPNRVWARLLGVDEEAPATATLIARQWSWLEKEQRLLASVRDGRQRRVTLLREDASGLPYTHPGLPSGSRPAEGDSFGCPMPTGKAAITGVWICPPKRSC